MQAFGVKLMRSLKAPVSARVGGKELGSPEAIGIRNDVLGTRFKAPGGGACEPKTDPHR